MHSGSGFASTATYTVRTRSREPQQENLQRSARFPRSHTNEARHEWRCHGQPRCPVWRPLSAPSLDSHDVDRRPSRVDVSEVSPRRSRIEARPQRRAIRPITAVPAFENASSADDADNRGAFRRRRGVDTRASRRVAAHPSPSSDRLRRRLEFAAVGHMRGCAHRCHRIAFCVPPGSASWPPKSPGGLSHWPTTTEAAPCVGARLIAQPPQAPQ